MTTKLNFSEIRDITVQTSLQLIPYVGSALSTAYFSTKQAIQFKRLESFYQELSQKIEQLEHMHILSSDHDEEYIIALIERLNEQIEKEASKEKREYFKNFFIHMLQSPTTESNYDEKRMFLDTLATVTHLEYQVLLSYSNHKESVQPFIEQLDPAIKLGAESRLVNLGLLITSFITETYVGQSPVHKITIISGFGQNFIRFCNE